MLAGAAMRARMIGAPGSAGPPPGARRHLGLPILAAGVSAPAAEHVQQDQPPGVPPLALTGERTLPDVPAENYWFRRHLAVYRWVAERCAGLEVVDMASGEGYGVDVLARRSRTPRRSTSAPASASCASSCRPTASPARPSCSCRRSSTWSSRSGCYAT